MLAREASDVLGHFNADQWLKALRRSRDLDAEPPVPPPAGVPHTPSLVRGLHFEQALQKGSPTGISGRSCTCMSLLAGGHASRNFCTASAKYL